MAACWKAFTLLMIINNVHSAPTSSPTLEPTCQADIDVIFIIDSSGSVYDPGYNNWQAELDAVKGIVNSSLPKGNSRVGLINFSGCGATASLEECRYEQNSLKKMWGLNEYGYDLEAVVNRVSRMNASDFNFGFTWTRQAMDIALAEFQSNSSQSVGKMMILMTDGEPFPRGSDLVHEPCITSTNYTSSTLLSLRNLGVKIITIGIDVANDTIDEFFRCIVDDFETDFMYYSDFASLSNLKINTESTLCSTISPTTSAPTPAGTPQCLIMTVGSDWHDGFNGQWHYNGQYDGQASYVKGTDAPEYMLEWSSVWGAYIVHTPPSGGNSAYGYCTAAEIWECGAGTWMYYDGTPWAPTAETTMSPCPTSATTPAPTYSPVVPVSTTQNPTERPTDIPSDAPTNRPTESPTESPPPTKYPTVGPTEMPSDAPIEITAVPTTSAPTTEMDIEMTYSENDGKISCQQLMDCDVYNGYYCGIDPECVWTNSIASCFYNRTCLRKYGICTSGNDDCEPEQECVVFDGGIFGYGLCIEYQ